MGANIEKRFQASGAFISGIDEIMNMPPVHKAGLFHLEKEVFKTVMS